MYPWKRFWCPRDGNLNLSDQGFLFDPDGEYGKIINPDVAGFEAISHFPCLALLGEPGIGKTTAIIAERQLVETASAARGEEILAFDLGLYGEESRLIAGLFENVVFREWASGESVLHLFLDSLDECRLLIPQIDKLLLSLLEKVRGSLTRLRLRIACRTADWTAIMDDSLPNLWGKENYGAYELMPLRRKDVIFAATHAGLDPDKFVDELLHAEAVPLAIKPLTLKMLLSVRKREGCFPESKLALYEKGCRALCEEFSLSRKAMRGAWGTGERSADQRMAVASRVAAISIFCARPIVVMDTTTLETGPGEVVISELAGGKEAVRGDDMPVDEASIREAVGTGLFTARGSSRMGFAHQTYAEFLAARYLCDHLDTAQILSLIRHSEDQDLRIIPQLRETAAWIAGMRNEILREIAVADPQVLLNADAASMKDDDRAILTVSLLAQHEAGEISDRDWELRKGYRKLAHPQLADQLLPVIQDGEKPVDLRRVAIDIAEACEVKTLAEPLLAIALDPTESIHVRSQAAAAVARIGDRSIREGLRPLAFNEAGPDPEDELKGWALRALWPELMTADELFNILTFPKVPNLYGAYKSFLLYELPETLNVDGIPLALSWVERLVRSKQRTHEIAPITDAVIVLGWKHLERPSVLAHMARVWKAIEEGYEDLVMSTSTREEHQELFSEQAKRRLFTTHLVRSCADAQGPSWRLVHRFPELIRFDDLPWVLSMLGEATDAEERRRWAKVAGLAWDRNPNSLNLIVEIARDVPELRQQFASLLDPVDLGSESARKMKEQHQQHIQMQERLSERRDPPPLETPQQVEIENALKRFEGGDVTAWTDVVLHMRLEDNGAVKGKLFEPDLTKLSGWQEADDTLRERIVAAARLYVLEGQLRSPETLVDGTMFWDQLAGFQALRLLRDLDPSFLDNLPGDVWRKWTPLLFALFGTDDEGKIQQELVALAYASVPEGAISVFLAHVEKDSQGTILVTL
jgi:hypothetical protein